MTDTKCYICGHALEEHAPYVVWHTGWDGCEECDCDYERGVSLCPVCIDALGYMGMTLGGNTYLPDLPFGEVGNWAYDTLWHAVWMPDDMTVGEAECARDYLDREGLKDLDPAWDSLPLRWWDTPEEFKASEYTEPFLRRFGLDEGDLDRLAEACLEHGDVLDDWHTVTDARKVGERLRKG